MAALRKPIPGHLAMSSTAPLSSECFCDSPHSRETRSACVHHLVVTHSWTAVPSWGHLGPASHCVVSHLLDLMKYGCWGAHPSCSQNSLQPLAWRSRVSRHIRHRCLSVSLLVQIPDRFQQKMANPSFNRCDQICINLSLGAPEWEVSRGSLGQERLARCFKWKSFAK